MESKKERVEVRELIVRTKLAGRWLQPRSTGAASTGCAVRAAAAFLSTPTGSRRQPRRGRLRHAGV